MQKYFCIVVTAFIAIASLLQGCGEPIKPKPTIKAVFSIKVNDPILKQLTEVTSEAKVDAVGQLKPGAYTVNGTDLRIAPGTKFEVHLTLPIDNPSVISTKDATGKLTTSSPIICKGVPLPQTIELQKGTATGELDLLRMFGAFMFSTLENQIDSEKNDIHQLIDTMNISQAELVLRPGSTCKLGRKLLHLGQGSTLKLSNVALDTDLNYHGICLADFKFLPDCQWIGERVDVDFNGGSGLLKLDAKRAKGVVTLTLIDKDPQVTLKDCSFKFGKNKRSLAHSDVCTMTMSELVWQKHEGEKKASMHLNTAMSLKNTHVDVKTDRHETDAQFPGVVPATLQVDIDENGRQTKFATDNAETASTGCVTIIRPTTKIALWLDNATLGPISLDKFGDLHFTFPHGTAKIKQLDWSSEAHTFHLVTAGASTLTLPEGMDLSLSKTPGGTKLLLPMKVKLGDATLTGATGKKMKLTKLNGDLLITVDGDCRISSDLDLSIARSSLLGDHHADVKARGFNLESRKGSANAHINSCAVTISENALKDAINAQLPKEREFEVNKEFDQRKWRYRNAVIQTVGVQNLHIDDITVKDANTLAFTVSGAVNCCGTVDKTGILSRTKENADVTTCSWRMWSEDVVGTGTVKYKLIPHDSLSASTLDYDLKMELPIPDDVQLDWSKVSHSLFGIFERKAILGQLKKMKVPVDYNGKLTICDKNDSQWSTVKISDFVAKPHGTETELHFVADASF